MKLPLHPSTESPSLIFSPKCAQSVHTKKNKNARAAPEVNLRAVIDLSRLIGNTTETAMIPTKRRPEYHAGSLVVFVADLEHVQLMVRRNSSYNEKEKVGSAHNT